MTQTIPQLILACEPYLVQPEAATGFSFQIPNGINIVYAKLTGTYANGTFIMPTSPLNGQLLRFATNNTITALTLTPSTGQTVVGAPAGLTINTGIAFFFDRQTGQWLRLY